MRLILFLLLSLTSIELMAQERFRCEMIPELRARLERLESQCGSTSQGLCKAAGYAGDTIESAIRTCSRDYSTTYCVTNVVCEGNMRVCYAANYAGNSIAEAIKYCTRDYSTTHCAKSVRCQGGYGQRICYAAGYAGDTIEEAVRSCSRDYSSSYCASNVKCE